MSVDRVQAVETALRNVQAQAAALEELSEQLSLSVHVLETEIAALAEEARSAREQAESMAAALAQGVPNAAADPAAVGPGAAGTAPGGALAGPASGAVANGTASQPQRSADADGARLVALNMALAGESREATERYLAEHYELPDRERLLDDVYAAVEA